jgi:hypothetical protein
MIAAQMLVCHDAAMECFAAQDQDKKNCSHEEQLYYRKPQQPISQANVALPELQDILPNRDPRRIDDLSLGSLKRKAAAKCVDDL